MSTLRTMVLTGATGAVLLLGAAPAAAGPKGVEFDFVLPADGSVVDGVVVDGYCDFPVRLEGVNAQRSTTRTLSDGTTVTRSLGAAIVTVTNERTGESVRLNASGPVTTVTAQDGSFRTDGTGPQLSITTVGNSFPGVSPLSYTTGRVFFEVDKTGMTTGYGVVGRVVDVCALLA